jgi:hypothetical protein
MLATLLNDSGVPKRGEPGMLSGEFYFGDECLANAVWVSLRPLEVLGPWDDAWLWLHKPDTSKTLGLHMYDRIRQSYGDSRYVEECPVHQFRGYEHADLCTVLTVALINEWSLHLLTAQDYARVFISQSSGAEVWVRDKGQLDRLESQLRSHGIQMSRNEFQFEASRLTGDGAAASSPKPHSGLTQESGSE